MFRLRTGLVTALADNPVGHLIEDLIYQGGVEQAHLDWREYDGIGRAVRNPLNFTEPGIGVRGALGCSDRGHSAASQMKPGDVEQVQGLRELLDRLGPHPDVEALVASDLEFHRRISAYSGNSALCSLLDSLSGPATRARLVL